MFRTAELGRKVSRRDFERQEPVLRQELLQIQQDLREDGSFPVIPVFAGVDGAGKGETVNLLNAWTAPRWIVTRAYAEINGFEEQLIEHGRVLRTFWSHITKEEQLARLRAREKTPYKRWKLTEEDWRSREGWNDYGAAVNDMVEQTGTKKAPWVLVEGNDKRFARDKVITTVCEAMARVLGDGND